ncbi:MAG: thiamine phosphate synthase [Rikenellaceae bacterium]|nr:thiamine phosphate synthase [Rikenellaceae bacterium]MDE7356466.1 thiamine phosphate synthase [Rikenellaceae bacterium]
MIVVITLPHSLPREDEALALIAAQEGVTIHLRRHNGIEALADTVRRVCGNDPGMLMRFSVHHNAQTAFHHRMGGTHRRFAERNEPCHGRLSLSCHSTDEAATALYEGKADYIFLSPVFDSISKPGYASAFDLDRLRAFLRSLPTGMRQKVVALGGVTGENITICREAGFGGAAMIGSAWVVRDGEIDPESTLDNIIKMRDKWQQTETR